MPLTDDKQALRRRALIARGACRPEWGADLARHVLTAALVRAGQAVAGFWPMADEIDLKPLLHALHGQGCTVLLPQTPPIGQALIFRRWQPGAAMVEGRFGTWHPDAAQAVPDVVLVPLLAFDRAGGRLGYGGGYYDRTLAALPGRAAIGCAFAGQEVPLVPMEPHDVRLDAVATEHGIVSCRKAD